jgi:hypothetical protein
MAEAKRIAAAEAKQLAKSKQLFGKKSSVDNPFIPPSDEQVFTMREAERRHKEEMKVELANKKVCSPPSVYLTAVCSRTSCLLVYVYI